MLTKAKPEWDLGAVLTELKEVRTRGWREG